MSVTRLSSERSVSQVNSILNDYGVVAINQSSSTLQISNSLMDAFSPYVTKKEAAMIELVERSLANYQGAAQELVESDRRDGGNKVVLRGAAALIETQNKKKNDASAGLHEEMSSSPRLTLGGSTSAEASTEASGTPSPPPPGSPTSADMNAYVEVFMALCNKLWVPKQEVNSMILRQMLSARELIHGINVEEGRFDVLYQAGPSKWASTTAAAEGTTTISLEMMPPNATSAEMYEYIRERPNAPVILPQQLAQWNELLARHAGVSCAAEVTGASQIYLGERTVEPTRTNGKSVPRFSTQRALTTKTLVLSPAIALAGSAGIQSAEKTAVLAFTGEVARQVYSMPPHLMKKNTRQRSWQRVTIHLKKSVNDAAAHAAGRNESVTPRQKLFDLLVQRQKTLSAMNPSTIPIASVFTPHSMTIAQDTREVDVIMLAKPSASLTTHQDQQRLLLQQLGLNEKLCATPMRWTNGRKAPCWILSRRGVEAFFMKLLQVEREGKEEEDTGAIKFLKMKVLPRLCAPEKSGATTNEDTLICVEMINDAEGHGSSPTIVHKIRFRELKGLDGAPLQTWDTALSAKGMKTTIVNRCSSLSRRGNVNMTISSFCHATLHSAESWGFRFNEAGLVVDFEGLYVDEESIHYDNVKERLQHRATPSPTQKNVLVRALAAAASTDEYRHLFKDKGGFEIVSINGQRITNHQMDVNVRWNVQSLDVQMKLHPNGNDFKARIPQRRKSGAASEQTKGTTPTTPARHPKSSDFMPPASAWGGSASDTNVEKKVPPPVSTKHPMPVVATRPQGAVVVDFDPKESTFILNRQPEGKWGLTINGIGVITRLECYLSFPRVTEQEQKKGFKSLLANTILRIQKVGVMPVSTGVKIQEELRKHDSVKVQYAMMGPRNESTVVSGSVHSSVLVVLDDPATTTPPPTQRENVEKAVGGRASPTSLNVTTASTTPPTMRDVIATNEAKYTASRAGREKAKNFNFERFQSVELTSKFISFQLHRRSIVHSFGITFTPASLEVMNANMKADALGFVVNNWKGATARDYDPPADLAAQLRSHRHVIVEADGKQMSTAAKLSKLVEGKLSVRLKLKRLK